MKMPAVTTSTGKLLRSSRFTLARMRANPNAKKHIVDLEPHHKALKAAQLAGNDADDEVVDADATVFEVDYAAREQLTDLQLNATAFVRRDYEHPLYRALFPKGLGDVKKLQRGELRDDVARVRSVLTDLAAEHALKKHAAPLAKTFKAWEAPLLGLTKANDAMGKADVALKAARSAWFDAYDGLAGSLRKEFPRQRNFVDSFFPEVKSVKVKPKGVEG